MQYKVNVTILDRGFLVCDTGSTYACNDGKELINCLSRIKAVEMASQDDDEDDDEIDDDAVDFNED